MENTDLQLKTRKKCENYKKIENSFFRSEKIAKIWVFGQNRLIFYIFIIILLQKNLFLRIST